MAGITFSEGSGLQDSVFGKSQAPIRMIIENKAEAFEETSVVKEVFMEDESMNYAEKYTSMTAMDGFQPVGENGAYPNDNMQEGYSKTLEHITWKDQFSISQEIIEDGKLLDLKKKPVAFTQSFYRTKEQLGAALFGNAIQGNTSMTFRGKTIDTTCNDALGLFSKVHPSIVDTSSTQTNLYANTFSAEALALAEAKMQNTKGDNENILGIVPNTIIIPNDGALKQAVFSVIGADKDPATANNGFNFLFGRWRVIVWPYLSQYLGTDTTPWILADLDYNENYSGAIMTKRIDLAIRSEIDMNTDANVWKGRARFTGGFADWRAFAVGGVTDGTTLS